MHMHTGHGRGSGAGAGDGAKPDRQQAAGQMRRYGRPRCQEARAPVRCGVRGIGVNSTLYSRLESLAIKQLAGLRPAAAGRAVRAPQGLHRHADGRAHPCECVRARWPLPPLLQPITPASPTTRRSTQTKRTSEGEEATAIVSPHFILCTSGMLFSLDALGRALLRVGHALRDLVEREAARGRFLTVG